MQLYCPRCEGDLERSTYSRYFHDEIWQNAHTWYAKLIAITSYLFAPTRDIYDPDMLRCTHCNYYVANIPSSYFKPGSVMVPKAEIKPKKVKTSTALIVIIILSAICVWIAYLNFQVK